MVEWEGRLFRVPKSPTTHTCRELLGHAGIKHAPPEELPLPWDSPETPCPFLLTLWCCPVCVCGGRGEVCACLIFCLRESPGV